MTRAREHLLLTKAAYRTMRGLRERTVTSPFINEMPADALEVTDRTGLAGGDDRTEYRDRFQDASSRFQSQFHRGQTVRHPTFGIGQITDISSTGQQTLAMIDFRTVGKKTLILEYARLEAVR